MATMDNLSPLRLSATFTLSLIALVDLFLQRKAG